MTTYAKNHKDEIAIAISRGLKLDALVKKYGVSRSTINRIVKEVKAYGIIPKRGRPSQTRSIPDANIGNGSSTPFPFPIYDPERFEKEINRLKNINIGLTSEKVITPWSHVGASACASFFPNRYNAIRKGSISAFEAWTNEHYMRRAISFQIKRGDPITPHRILRALTLICRTPTIFKPSIAKFIYARYCSKVTWDPCAGYGGRLLGAFAAGVHYIGTDVEIATIEGNKKLAEVLGTNHELIMSPAESFDPPKVDLVFTSPPYFDRECYSENKNQSWKKHGQSLSAWIEGFLRPVIERARIALSIDGFLALNVANIKNNTVPIIDRTISVAIESGFRHIDTLRIPLAAINRAATPYEPILIFQ